MRLTALAVVGVAMFLHSPASLPVLAAQAAAFVSGTAALSVYMIIDYRFPPALPGTCVCSRSCWLSPRRPAGLHLAERPPPARTRADRSAGCGQ